MNCKEKLLEVRDIHKVYTKEGVPTKALNGITFDVLDGEFLGIMGASGSGKTTLLNCIATVIKPTSGQVLLSGANVSSFDSEKLAEYRGNKIGYLFQDFALLDNLTGRENILLPLSIHNVDISAAEKKLNDIAGLFWNHGCALQISGADVRWSKTARRCRPQFDFRPRYYFGR